MCSEMGAKMVEIIGDSIKPPFFNCFYLQLQLGCFF